MLRFLKSILKNKKSLFFVLLFFVAMGAILPGPKVASAVEFCGGFVGAAMGNSCPEGFFCSGPVAGVCLPNPAAGVIDNVNLGAQNVAVNAAISIFKYLALIPLFLSGILDFIAGTILVWVIRMTNTVSFTNNQAVNLGWPIARDFANIIIVLGFIAIALATILRFKEYEARALLAKLIVAALLVNFSLVICGILIDVSNITIRYFLDIGTNATNGFVNFAAFERAVNSVNADVSTGTVVPFIAGVMGNVFYNIMSAIVLALFAFLFLFRIIALWILVILSPLAFICYVFPGTQSIWSMWWSNFRQWCIIGIPGAFFLYLGNRLVESMSTNLPTMPRIENELSGVPAFMDAIFQHLLPFFTMFVPGIFLIIGFIFSLQVSAMGSNVALGMFNRAKGYAAAGAGYAWKGTKFAGGRTLDKAGLTDQWTQFKKGAIQVAEKVPIIGPAAGTGAKLDKAKKEDDLKKAKETAKYASPEVMKNEVLKGATVDPVEASKRAAYAEEMVANGTFATLEHDEQVMIAKAATKAGSSWDTFTKANPDLVEHDKKGQDAILRSLGKDPLTASKTERDSATQTLRERAQIKKGTEQLKNMSPDEKIKYIENENADVVTRGDIARTSLAAQIYEEAADKKWLHKLGDAQQTGDAISYHDKHFGTTTMSDAKKLNLHLSKYDEKGKKTINEDRIKDGLPALLGKDLDDEALKKAVENTSVDKFAEIEGMDDEIWGYANDKQKQRFIDKAKPGERNRLVAKLLKNPIASKEDLDYIKYDKLEPKLVDPEILGSNSKEIINESSVHKINDAIINGSIELRKTMQAAILDAASTNLDTANNPVIDPEKIALISKGEIGAALRNSTPATQARLKARLDAVNVVVTNPNTAITVAEEDAARARGIISPPAGTMRPKTKEELQKERLAGQKPQLQALFNYMKNLEKKKDKSKEDTEKIENIKELIGIYDPHNYLNL